MTTPQPTNETTFSMEDVVGLLALADSLSEAGVEGDVPDQLRNLAGRIAVLCRAEPVMEQKPRSVIELLS